FRGFAERVRKTLAGSGAKKNAAVLETAGVAAGTGPSPSGSEGVKTKPARSKSGKKPTGPSLFDQIYETEGTADGAPAAVSDGWSYEGYSLVDTPAAFKQFLAELKKQKAFVFDLETTGLDPIRSEIVGYAF